MKSILANRDTCAEAQVVTGFRDTESTERHSSWTERSINPAAERFANQAVHIAFHPISDNKGTLGVTDITV
jgi:hypothetical protein